MTHILVIANFMYLLLLLQLFLFLGRIFIKAKALDFHFFFFSFLHIFNYAVIKINQFIGLKRWQAFFIKLMQELIDE